MHIPELDEKFQEISDIYASETQLCIKHCGCDSDIKSALDEIARQTFYAIAETQNAVIKYLSKK